MMFEFFSHNGKLRQGEPSLPLRNIAYQYGFGVYETLRVSGGAVYFLSEHLDRLIASAAIIGLAHPFPKEQLEQWVMALVAQTSEQAFNIKMLLVGAPDPAEVQLFIIPLAPLFPEKILYRDGAAAITYAYERLFPKAKTLNMLGSYLAYSAARGAGCYDALLLDRDGIITEGTRTNFFAIKDKTIYGARNEKILDGVTMMMALRVARDAGFEVAERDIRPADLGAYDGAFLTSTSSKIMPLRKIDDFEFSAVPAALCDLMNRFDEFLSRPRG